MRPKKPNNGPLQISLLYRLILEILILETNRLETEEATLTLQEWRFEILCEEAMCSWKSKTLNYIP